jgi:glutamate synthase (NADPH/NADH) large chain
MTWYPATLPGRLRASAERIWTACPEKSRQRVEKAFPIVDIPSQDVLEVGGKYKWRRDGERHQYNPLTIARLQQAVRGKTGRPGRISAGKSISRTAKADFCAGLFEMQPVGRPVLLDEVEPWHDDCPTI